MRNAFLAGASAFALVLGGCSMFQSGDSNARNTGFKEKPAISGSSQAPSQAQSQTQRDAATDHIGSSTSPSMSGHAMTGSATTKHGSASSISADQVKQAQQKLKDSGDYMGQVDGKFGSKTAQAVKQFQKKNGLQQSGRLDRDTLGKLGVGTTASGSSAPPAAAPSSGSSMPPVAAPSSGSSTPPAAAPNAATSLPPAGTGTPNSGAGMSPATKPGGSL
jgi:peptidoglycan hydrolase-like protein with peptidoglycan-binding domain